VSDYSDDDYITAYIALRDRKEDTISEHNKKIAIIDDQMEAIEARVLALLNARGSQQTSSTFGTAYKETKTKSRVVDKSAFFEYVNTTKRFDLLTSHVSKKVVHDIVEATGSPPPGVHIDQEIRVIFRRK
jgi:hypothetical protein